MVEGWSRVRGARLRWTATGDGPLVVFAHGLAGDPMVSRAARHASDWSAIPRAGRRLVRFDARGA